MKAIIVLLAIFAVVNADIVFLNASSEATEKEMVKCPAVVCKSSANSEKGKACEKFTGSMADKNKKVEFNDCAADEICKIEIDFVQGSSDGLCEAKPEPQPAPEPTENTLYPGEATTDNKFCAVIKTGEAKKALDNGKCPGLAADADCDGYQIYACLPNLYCQANTTVTPNTKSCKPLQKESNPCGNSYECENGLVCLTTTKADNTEESKCSKLFSLIDNTEVKFAGLGHNVGDSFACKSNFIVKSDNKTFCAKQTYDTNHKADDIKNGFAKCGYGEKCKYVNTFGKDKTTKDDKDCVCGFRGENGICPPAMSDSGFANALKTITEANIEKYTLSVHPNKKYLTAQSTDKKKSSLCLGLYASEKVHGGPSCLVKNYEDCDQALLSGKFITFSMMILGFLAMMF